MSAATLNPERSGVYRTPDDTEALRRSPGVRWVEIGLGIHADKASLMRSFARALGLPATFGENWDALADALQDLPWDGVDAYVLDLRGANDTQAELAAVWPTLLDVLATSAAWWRARRKTFVVFVDRAARLPEWV